MLKTTFVATGLSACLLLFSCGSPKAEAPSESLTETKKPAESTANVSALATPATAPAKPSANLTPEAPQEDSSASIVGTWVSEEDANWKLVFTADQKCTQYYQGELSRTGPYSISNTSPQCGEEVLVDAMTSYLQLTNLEDADQICYEINGITNKYLSLRVLGRGGAMVFLRQKS